MSEKIEVWTVDYGGGESPTAAATMPTISCVFPVGLYSMTIGVSHDPATGDVVLVDATARQIYDFSPQRAQRLAAQLRVAAAAEGLVLVIAKADDGRELRIGGTAENAISMGDDLDRNADLGMTIRSRKRGGA